MTSFIEVILLVAQEIKHDNTPNLPLIAIETIPIGICSGISSSYPQKSLPKSEFAKVDL